MNQTISYDEAQRRYPTLVAEVMEQLANSRSKYKNTPADKMLWGLSWGVRIEGTSFPQLLMQISGVTKPKKPKVLNEDEYVADYWSRCSMTLYGMPNGRSGYYSKSKVDTIPTEVEYNLRMDYKRDQEERKRINNMSEDEREADMVGLLSQLAGPGFAMIGAGGVPWARAKLLDDAAAAARLVRRSSRRRR